MAAKLPGSLAAGLSPSTSQCGTATRRGPAGLCHRLGGRHLFPGHLKAAAPLLPHPTLPAPLGPQGAAEPGAPAPPMLEPLSREFLSCPVTQRPCLDLSVVEGWAGQVWGTVSRCFLTSGSWRDPEGHTLPCPHLHWPLPPWSPPSSLWLTPPEVAQLCLTLCDPMDCSLPGSSVNGIFQARILEWGAIYFSRGSSHPGIEPGSPAL